MINNVQRELFSIDVDVLSFKIYLDNNNYSSESSCIITNLTDDYIAFRTKTTKKEDYAVKPTHAILMPKASTKIVFNKHSLDLDPTGHKFKFDAIVISESDKDKDIKSLFEEARTKNVETYSLKRGVEFIKIEKQQSMYSMEENESQYKESKHSSTNNTKGNANNNNQANNEQAQKDQLEFLKVEYYKLKNQLAMLTQKYNNLKNRVDMEKKKDSPPNRLNDVIETHEPQISTTIGLSFCFLAILIGYYLSM